jgi:hypothetical protein
VFSSPALPPPLPLPSPLPTTPPTACPTAPPISHCAPTPTPPPLHPGLPATVSVAPPFAAPEGGVAPSQAPASGGGPPGSPILAEGGARLLRALYDGKAPQALAGQLREEAAAVAWQQAEKERERAVEAVSAGPGAAGVGVGAGAGAGAAGDGRERFVSKDRDTAAHRFQSLLSAQLGWSPFRRGSGVSPEGSEAVPGLRSKYGGREGTAWGGGKGAKKRPGECGCPCVCACVSVRACPCAECACLCALARSGVVGRG